MNTFSESVVSRFWSKVEVLGKNDCWTWLGTTGFTGYGHFGINGKTWRAHRYSYEINVGPIGDLCVLHTCDNPGCVNPDHLWLGTHSDNMADRNMKGRVSVGNRAGYRKLSQNQIKEIREKYATNTYSQKQLAEEYAVSQATIFNTLDPTQGAYNER